MVPFLLCKPYMAGVCLERGPGVTLAPTEICLAIMGTHT